MKKILVLISSIVFSFDLYLILNPTLAFACDTSQCDCKAAVKVVNKSACSQACYAMPKDANTVFCYPQSVNSLINQQGQTQKTSGLGTPNQWLNTIGQGANLPSGDLSYVTKTFIPFLVSAFLFILITASLFFLLIGGIKWIISGGDKEAVAKAKGTVTYAVIGLVLGLGSFMIIATMSSIFNVDLGLGVPSGRECKVSRSDYNKFCAPPVASNMQFWCSTVKSDCRY